MRYDSNRDYGRVAVLMGGTSAEREISLQGGRAVLAALLRKGISAEGLEVTDGYSTVVALTATQYDRVFILLHGRGGEDGSIQGLLTQLNLPATGSGVLASALAMDKCVSKQLWMQQGLPTPAFVILDEESSKVSTSLKNTGLPVLVKPAREGSSFGATKVTVAARLHDAWLQAQRFDEKVMAEAWIEGDEYTVAILEGEALPLIKLETTREFYDYTAKYDADDTRYLCPCGLSIENEKALQKLALDACDCLQITGWARVDLMVDKDNQPWLIEVNTIPGMTAHSLVPKSAKQAGMDFDDLAVRILDTTFASVAGEK